MNQDQVKQTDTKSVTNGQIERVSTAQLLKRYGLKSRSSLANRLQALNISTYKEGKTFYIASEQVPLLDELNKCLSSGKTILECINSMDDRGVEIFKIQGLSQQFSDSSICNEHTDSIPRLEIAIAPQSLQALTALVSPIQSELDRLRSLDEAMQKNWLLPTSVLLSLLGLRSIPKLINGCFSRRGFTFVKTPKVSRQAEWKIKKI